MKCCFGQFLLYRPKYCLQMLRRQALEVLFKVLLSFVTKNWSTEESQKSSTWRELVAINFALEAFDNHLAGQTLACSRLLIRKFLESSRLVVCLKNHKTSF